MAGLNGIPSWSIFSGIKHAVRGFMNVIREENKDYFDVVMVFPSILDSGMETRLITGDGNMSGPTGSYRFDVSYIKADPYFMPVDEAAELYVKRVECSHLVRNVYLNFYNTLGSNIREYSEKLADFLYYMSIFVPSDDVLQGPKRFYDLFRDFCEIDKALRLCGSIDQCNGFGVFPKITLLEKKVDEVVNK